MSHSFSTNTFTLAPEDLPASFSSVEAFDAFYQNLPGADNSKMLTSVSGSSRGGWATYLTQHLLQDYNFTRLQFLTANGQQYNFEDEYGNISRLSILRPAELPEVIAELEQLLLMLKDNADAVYFADEVGVFSEGEVEAALERDYVCANPAYDAKVAGEDGQSADYLFVLLRSKLMLLKNAQQTGSAVLHLLRI